MRHDASMDDAGALDRDELSALFTALISNAGVDRRLAEAEAIVLERFARDHGEVVAGTLGDDGLEILPEFVAGPSEMSEFSSRLTASQQVFFGPFPGRGIDAVDANTLTLPDVDGIVRAHPQ